MEKMTLKTKKVKRKRKHGFLSRMKSELGLTHVEIGNLLGGRDHTTIMYGVEKIGKLVDKKEKISEDIMGITRFFRG